MEELDKRDAQLLAACGRYTSIGERDAWIFVIQAELANVGVIPAHKISWASDNEWFGPGVAVPPLSPWYVENNLPQAPRPWRIIRDFGLWTTPPMA